MKKILFTFSIFLYVSAFISCSPNDNNDNSLQNDGTFAQNFGSSVARDFIGQVVDADNKPIQNATVKIGTTTAQTDVNGVFIINGANVFERFAYITAQKVGYIDGSRSMIPTNGKNNLKIMMLSGNVVGTVTSGAPSEVALPNETKIKLDGSFKTETGTSYSGSVSVSMNHLGPTNPNIADKMPGMLYAQTDSNQEAVLETYGMMNVELRGSSGEKLQIVNPAQIELPISSSQLATAPSTIPL